MESSYKFSRCPKQAKNADDQDVFSIHCISICSAAGTKSYKNCLNFVGERVSTFREDMIIL